MAAANLTTHLPIAQVKSKTGTMPYTQAQPEAAGQTFVSGTPVQLNALGFTQAWDGATITSGVLGIAESFGLNLATAGAGAPVLPFGQITGTQSTVTYGSVPNQPGAVNIPLGAPVSDGRTLYLENNDDTVFEAMFDNATGAVAADWTPTQADIGKSYGLTKDSVGPYWYVDKSKTAANACLKIIEIGPDGFVLNGRVRFTFLLATQQAS